MAFGAKIKLSVNTSGASAFRREIQKYVNTATKDDPIKVRIQAQITNPATQLKDLAKQLNQAGGITKVKLSEVDATGAIKKLRTDIQTMLRGLNIAGLKEFLGNEGIEKTAEEIERAKQSSAQWASQLKVVNDIANRLATTYKSGLSGTNMLNSSADITAITARYTAWQEQVELLRSTQAAMSAEELASLQAEGIAIQQLISALQAKQAEERQGAREREKNEATAAAAAKKEQVLAQQQVSLRYSVQRYIMSNSKAYKEYGNSLDRILIKLQNEGTLTEEQLKANRLEFAKIQSNARAAGLAGNTFFDTLKKGWEKFGGWSLVTRSMMTAYRLIRNMIVAVKDLDDAMTELKKVTDLADASYEKFLQRAQSMAISVGASLADTVNATADFARLGYSINESANLAEAALVYKNVGDGIEDISEASESLISTIKAFGVEADNAMQIVDKFNEVGNNFAISSSGIGVALQKSASSLAAANNSLEESIALATAMNSVLQNPEVVGTALKTVSMYLRAAKTEAEDAGESTDGMANSVSELRQELLKLTNGKVDIMLDDKNFKSTYQIMKEMASVWEDLSDVDTANILELIGGKRNATAITSLITNFQDAEDALKSANAAAGSATAENEKYLESISGKLDVLHAKFETFSNNLIGSDAVKFVVDLGNGLLTVLDPLARINLLLPLVIASVVLLKLVQLARQAQQSALAEESLTAQLIAEKTATSELATSFLALTAVEQKSVLTKLNDAVATGKLTQAEYNDIAAKLGVTGATAGLKGATDALNVSIKSLLLSNPVGWIILAISLIPFLTSLVSKFIGSCESSGEKIARLNDEMKETADNIQSIAKEYRDLKKSADDVIPRFVELAKGVDDFGKNVSLTDEEYEEFLSLNNKIAEMFPELNLGMDSNGNAMLALSYSANTLSESLWELVEAQRQAANKQIADEELPDLIDKATEVQKEYNDQIDAYTEKINLIKGLAPGGIAGFMNTDATTINTYEQFLKDYDIKNKFHYTPDTFVQTDANGGGYMQTGYSWYNILEDDEKKLQDAIDNYVINQEKLIDDAKERINKQWQKITPAINSWVQTEESFQELDDELQAIMSRMIGNIDIASLNVTDGTDDLKSQIKKWFIDPLVEATPDAKVAVKNLFNTMTDFNSGDINYSQFEMAVSKLIADLQDAGFDNKFINTLTLTLNIDDIEDKAKAVRDLLKDEYKDSVDEFNAREIELAYRVKAANGSLTLDELKREMLEMSFAGADMVNVLDFSPMKSKLDDISGSVGNLTSAMQKLREGTALTKAEVAKLVLEYPKLLESANLFSNGTIEGQNRVLDNLLQNYESEYDATIDAKIAELKATNECLQSQIELEGRKAELLNEIKVAETNGKIDSEEWLTNKIAEFNDLQGRNYVSMENGILTVNENALNEQMGNANAAAEENTDAWAQSASDVTSFYNASANASVDATNQAQEKIRTKINGIGEWFKALWQSICRLFSTGEWKWGILEEVYDDSDINVGLNAKVNGKYNYNTIDNKPIKDWVADQEKALSERLDNVKLQYETNLNIINNLKDLKGLDLTSIYGSKSGSSSTKKEVDEYFADVDEYYAAVKRLEEAQTLRKNIEDELSHTDDPAAKIKLYDKLVDAYKAEAAAETNLMNKRKSTIEKNAKALRALGFQVEYNSKTNRLFIKNLDHINDLVATSKGKYDSLQEATNALRKETEELIDITEDLNDANRDAIDNIEDLTYEIQDAAEEIIDCIEEIYKKQIDAYNEIIAKRKEAIESAKDEYDYEQDVADKVKEIADLQSRIAKLSLDDSRAAQAQRAALEEELAEKQKDLNDTQRDHSYDAQIDQLDKMSKQYEDEKNAEIELLKQSIGTVQDLGTTIDQRITNAWKNAKKAVKEYGDAVAGLNGSVVGMIGNVPKYHSGGVVSGGSANQNEVLAMLEKGEWVLDDTKKRGLYEIIDFHKELAKRLGTVIGEIGNPISPIRSEISVNDIPHGIVDNSTKTVFEPKFKISISHNGNMDDNDAMRYGEEIANVAIDKLYSAFERKGITNRNGSKLKP